MKDKVVPTKILFVSRSTTAHPISGGMESSFEQVARALHASGHSLSLLTTEGYDLDGLPDIFTNIWTVAGSKPGRYSFLWWVKTMATQAPWLKWEPDLVFSVSTAATSLCLMPNRGFKLLGQSHGTALSEVRSSRASLSYRELAKVPLNLSRIPREIVAYHRFDRTIAVGPSVEHQLLKRPYKMDPSKVALIENGINVADFAYSSVARSRVRESLSIPLDSRVSLFVGRLHFQKGVDLVLRSFAEVANEGSHLIIVGSGPEETRLRTLVSDLGVQENVHFVGRVRSVEVPSFLSAADIFVFPTRRKEGLPLNILEALASGLEVVTVPDSSLPDTLIDRVHLSPTMDEFAAVWSKVIPADNRTSRLPDQFTAESANDRYVKTIAEQISIGRPE